MTLRPVRQQRRRATDHGHDDYWEVSQQHRYEDSIGRQLEGVNKKLDTLTQRVTLLMGAIGVLIFAIPIIAPFVRSALNLP